MLWGGIIGNLRFLRKIPGVLFALLDMLPCTSNLHSVAFNSILNFIDLPGRVLIGLDRIKVSLQKGGIEMCFDVAVEDAIIGKEMDCTINGFVGEVVDVN